jgi:hypothetical protein
MVDETRQVESKSVGVVVDVVTSHKKETLEITTSCPLMFGRGLVGGSGGRARAQYGCLVTRPNRPFLTALSNEAHRIMFFALLRMYQLNGKVVK